VKSGALAQRLEKLGLRAREDFLLHLPLRYEDETALAPPGEAPPVTPVYLEARVVRTEIAYRPRRQLVVHALWGELPLALRFCVPTARCVAAGSGPRWRTRAIGWCARASRSPPR